MGQPGSAEGAAEVSDHVAGSKRLNHFCKMVSAVESLSKDFLSLAECALVSNVERLRDLHHDKQWPTAEVKKLMGFSKRLEAFGLKHNMHLSVELFGELDKLAAALEPAMARSQKSVMVQSE